MNRYLPPRPRISRSNAGVNGNSRSPKYSVPSRSNRNSFSSRSMDICSSRSTYAAPPCSDGIIFILPSRAPHRTAHRTFISAVCFFVTTARRAPQLSLFIAVFLPLVPLSHAAHRFRRRHAASQAADKTPLFSRRLFVSRAAPVRCSPHKSPFFLRIPSRTVARQSHPRRKLRSCSNARQQALLSVDIIPYYDEKANRSRELFF